MPNRGRESRPRGLGRSFLLRLQLDPDQAAAEPVAQREAPAATSHGTDPPAQSHCYFLLAFSPLFWQPGFFAPTSRSVFA